MADLDNSRTYNDAKLDEEARRLTYESIQAARKVVAEGTPSPERLHALSQTIIAGCAAMNEDDGS